MAPPGRPTLLPPPPPPPLGPGVPPATERQGRGQASASGRGPAGPDESLLQQMVDMVGRMGVRMRLQSCVRAGGGEA